MKFRENPFGWSRIVSYALKDRWTDSQTETNTTKLTVVFRNFMNVSTKLDRNISFRPIQQIT